MDELIKELLELYFEDTHGLDMLEYITDEKLIMQFLLRELSSNIEMMEEEDMKERKDYFYWKINMIIAKLLKMVGYPQAEEEWCDGKLLEKYNNANEVLIKKMNK